HYFRCVVVRLPAGVQCFRFRDALRADLAQARKCTLLASVTLPRPRPLAHYVRSLGLRRAVGSLSL
ncbi:hypothetical protein MMS54_29015, partial [Escherichia coli]